MAGCLIVRAETRATMDRALALHFGGQIRPDTARRDGSGCEDLRVNLRGAREAIDAYEAGRKRKRRRAGRRAHHCVDMFFGGPPGYETEGQWPEDRERAWAADVVAWVEATFPRSVIALASLHRDESAPHVHVLMCPIADDGTYGWTAVSEQARKRVAPESRRRRGQDYSLLQDAAHEALGVPYGLSRGEKGSGRRHVPVDAVRGAERAVEISQEKAARTLHEAERDAALLRSGDEAIGASRGLTLTRKAKAGRAERKRLEAAAREADEGRAAAEAERDAAKAEADALRTQLQEAESRYKVQRDGLVEDLEQAQEAKRKARAAQRKAEAERDHANATTLRISEAANEPPEPSAKPRVRSRQVRERGR